MTPAPPAPIGSAPPLRGPVLMNQSWLDAAFLHWAVPPGRVREFLPPGVFPDVRDGVTYVGLIPFRMVGAGVGRGPGVPWAGTFLETNVRLYSVDATGRRGIVFRTLECSRLVVVAGAHAGFGLPYRWARMRFEDRTLPDGRRLGYETRGRLRRSQVTSRIELDVGGPVPDEGLELARWLSSRWGLHQRHVGRSWYVPNEHEDWPLHTATLRTFEDGLLAATGFPELASHPPDHVMFSPGVTTRFGLPHGLGHPPRD